MSTDTIEEPIRLLLVEDHPPSGAVMCEILSRHGINVHLLETAEQALRALVQPDFDIVVADIRLGGMSGIELLRRIRPQDPDFPVILVTGADSVETAIEAVRLGAQDYILKPFENVNDLLGPVLRAVGHYRLIVQNRTLQAQLRGNEKQARRQLRALGARLVEVQEAERRALARELHDQVGQSLTALGISLNVVQGLLSDQSRARVEAQLEDALRQVERTTDCIRTVMAELRPPVLDDYGLVAALRWYAQGYTQRAGIRATVQGTELKPRLDSEKETALFRIAQEALTNVLKHAQADTVSLALWQGRDRIRLEIADNGSGFDRTRLEPADNGSGWGLVTMRERALAAGGRFQIETAPGRGTRVTVDMPSANAPARPENAAKQRANRDEHSGPAGG